jgi:hypothetical protein
MNFYSGFGSESFTLSGRKFIEIGHKLFEFELLLLCPGTDRNMKADRTKSVKIIFVEKLVGSFRVSDRESFTISFF